MKRLETYKKKLSDYYNSDNKYFLNLEKNYRKNKKRYLSEFSIQDFKKGTIFDAGCGSGAMAMDLAKKLPKNHIIGGDISEYAIRHAKTKAKKEKIKNIEFKAVDLEKLSFEDGSLDNILLFDVLEHVVYPKKLFREFYRVLKKKGKVIIVSPNLVVTKRVPFSLKVREAFESVMALLGTVSFNHVKPNTQTCGCGDGEACLVTNPVKIRQELKKTGFSIKKGTLLRCKFVAIKR